VSPWGTAAAISTAVLVSLGAWGCRSLRPAPPAPPGAARPDPARAEPTPPEGFRHTLRWTTASEVDNFGYDVYRSERPDGPFERITERPIPGAGTSDVPRRYEFVDSRVDPHRAYYYYVESISMSGQRQRFTPIIRSAPQPP
jgi:hypothetical protein